MESVAAARVAGGISCALSCQVTIYLCKHGCRRGLSAIHDGRGKVRNRLRKG
ncbi:hypothetical protein BDV40DRAFT_268318 [Aspergillus tamarii]|uniref:Uncharacterized protein n=1 Tax=Aspergillus tamarii TaxID=41984 RepID=A0A5N6URD3_ASPTM|nr:hypothetical protein BDV40DRAFT_268318 [Aspergillus tamarii]